MIKMPFHYKEPRPQKWTSCFGQVNIEEQDSDNLMGIVLICYQLQQNTFLGRISIYMGIQCLFIFLGNYENKYKVI